MVKLYKVLIDNDATMVEINPMTEDKNGQGTTVLYVSRVTHVCLISPMCLSHVTRVLYLYH